MDSRIHIWSIFKPHHFWSNSFWIYHHYYLSWLIYPEVLCFFNCDSFRRWLLYKTVPSSSNIIIIYLDFYSHSQKSTAVYLPPTAFISCFLWGFNILFFFWILANKVFGTYLGPKGPQRFLIMGSFFDHFALCTSLYD